MDFKFVVDDQIYENASLEQIYDLRKEPINIHYTDDKGVTQIYTYEEFINIEHINQQINCIELKRNITTKRGVGSVSSSDLNVTHSPKMDYFTFLKTASSLVPRFTDNALELDFFVAQVCQLQEATPLHLQDKLVTFVLGRLSGKAKTAASDCATIAEIINALERDIVPESSEILESKLSAITFDNKNLTDFATSVESVADQLTAAYISEGVRKHKAIQMVTKLVIENCKKSTRVGHIKTILSAASFSSPRDVLTTEIADLPPQNSNSRNRHPNDFSYQPRRSGRSYSNHHNNDGRVNSSQPSNNNYNNSVTRNRPVQGYAHNQSNNRSGPPNNYNNRGTGIREVRYMQEVERSEHESDNQSEN